MNLLHLYLSASAFIGVIGLMWFLSEINMTSSSYGIRKVNSKRYLTGLEFTLWFYKREEELIELWESEICESMNQNFDLFCWGVFEDKFEIRYV